MGNEKSKAAPPMSMEDAILEMRMTSKRFEMESRRAEKDKEKEINKAKNALKKGNEEGARLFLANSAMKQKESLQLLRMAHKIDSVSTTIKANLNSKTMAEKLSALTPLLNIHSQSIPIEKIYSDMQSFEKSMDDILIMNKMITETTGKVMGDTTQDMAVENMMEMLKKEHRAEIERDLENNKFMGMNQIKSPSQMNSQQDQVKGVQQNNY